jgi:GNAT superfamily N-acetyltransferase
MLAVDPTYQSCGLGTVLTEHATEWLRDVGMVVAMIGTGDDDGHALQQEEPTRRPVTRSCR